MEKSRNLPPGDARRELAERGTLRGQVQNKNRIETQHTENGKKWTSRKRPTPKQEARDAAKGLILAVKSSAFRVVDDYVTSKMKLKTFKSAEECIETLRLFLLEHFGPLEAPERLDNMHDAIGYRYNRCYSELAIYRKLFGSLQENPDLRSQIGGLPIAGPLESSMWTILKSALPDLSGDIGDINVGTLVQCLEKMENTCGNLDPEIMSHFEFCKKYLKDHKQ